MIAEKQRSAALSGALLASGNVQADETLVGKRQYHSGRYVRQIWVAGVCESRPGGHVHAETVGDRSRRTLLPFIQNIVSTPALITTDEWAGYTGLAELGYTHHTVNHSEHYVDPVTRAHTQRIESLWRQMKFWLAQQHLLDHERIDSYVLEWCFRYNHDFDVMSVWSAIFD
jgi:hypothetical protein